MGYQDHCFILKFVVYYKFLMRIFVGVYCIYYYYVSCILFIKKKKKTKIQKIQKKKKEKKKRFRFKKEKEKRTRGIGPSSHFNSFSKYFFFSNLFLKTFFFLLKTPRFVQSFPFKDSKSFSKTFFLNEYKKIHLMKPFSKS